MIISFDDDTHGQEVAFLDHDQIRSSYPFPLSELSSFSLLNFYNFHLNQ